MKNVSIEISVPRFTVLVDGKRLPPDSPEIPEEYRGRVAEVAEKYREELLYQARDVLLSTSIS